MFKLLWDVLIEAKNKDIPLEKIKFIIPEKISPYMEINSIDLNEVDTLGDTNIVEVNPYIRFYEMFEKISDDLYIKKDEIREAVYNIIMHLLGQIDLTEGTYRGDYELKFLERELLNGKFGNIVKINYRYFTKDEKTEVLWHILNMYRRGDLFGTYKDILKKLYTRSIIYLMQEEKSEVLIYLGAEDNNENRGKIEFLHEMFLPMEYSTRIFWKCHFGIIGAEDTMSIDEIEIF